MEIINLGTNLEILIRIYAVSRKNSEKLLWDNLPPTNIINTHHNEKKD